MADLSRTPLFDRHVALGAKMVEFGGWEMPILYPSGIVEEHLATRKHAGLFDVSHMGRFILRGRRALDFLQHVLTNNAAGLEVGEAQYTVVPTETGGAVDDAYLYRFVEDEYLLVVNAANRAKDWRHFSKHLDDFEDVELVDRTGEIGMMALQGPGSKAILERVIERGSLPEPVRNALSRVQIDGATVMLARTGYTGEPLCFELFASAPRLEALWDRLIEEGASPAGLGARDTLRLEAGLPLYGHELGSDARGEEIPVFAIPLARFAVSLSPLKGKYVGREALSRQHAALERITRRDFSDLEALPRRILPVAVTGRGVAREGTPVCRGERHVGAVTSGTMVPYWVFEGEGLESVRTERHQLRSIALAYVESDVIEDDRVSLEIRGRAVEGLVVPYHLKSDAPPYARPILAGAGAEPATSPEGTGPRKARRLIRKAVENHRWRQEECVNLIPSEMTLSPLARRLSVMDPAHRYAEHREVEAFCDADVFYYQGTDFIEEVEHLLEAELRTYLGCPEVETRVVSGQMANAAVFSALVDYLNRADPKREPLRIPSVMNNHITKGGHLSAQPMGALKDFIARDPKTERPAVVNFPVLPENPYRMDVQETCALIERHRPELLIFGKSMVLHREPVREIRRFLEEQGIDAVVMYDMAHVLGLVGPHFQSPFEEGADLVTGSTHKTYFGTQRGVIGCRHEEHEERYALWEAIRRRTFPGSVSNHHLGTLVGLLLAAYEMNHFKEAYQPAVIRNAKAFARALAEVGLRVAGDSSIGYTETHQVVLDVGYGRGPEMAKRLEASNVICNYQARPDEEGFTASGALRMGVAEMTRFGMQPEDFAQLAELVRAVVEDGVDVRDEVVSLRSRFTELKFCFSGDEFSELLHQLDALV